MRNTQGLKRRSARTGRTRFGVAGLAIGATMLAGGMLLAGCSGSFGQLGRLVNAGGAVPSAAGRRGTEAGSGSQPPRRSARTGTTVRLAHASDIIYTAQLTVRAQNVGSAASKATQVTEGVGGYVSNENKSSNPDHPSQATATVQLKIPVASYPGTLGQLAGSLGTQLSLQQQAQDVTEQVADVNSQVASFEAAIAQLRALLSHAGSVNDLLNVQNQINQEETQLEALQAQQRALSHETTYATVTVTILGPKAKPVAPPEGPAVAGRRLGPAGTGCG